MVQFFGENVLVKKQKCERPRHFVGAAALLIMVVVAMRDSVVRLLDDYNVSLRGVCCGDLYQIGAGSHADCVSTVKV